MELIPHDELRVSHSWNFAPMIDFLFLMLALFASLAISKTVLHDTKISLAEVGSASPSSRGLDTRPIHISIDGNGHYAWITQFQEYPMASLEEIQQELARQHQLGILPAEKNGTEILLHIDKKAPWDPIAKAIFAMQELGFEAHPVYEAER